MPPLDTTPEIEEKQIRFRRTLTPGQCLQIAVDLSMFVRELQTIGIRQEHPDWTERQIMMELFRLACLPSPLPVWLR